MTPGRFRHDGPAFAPRVHSPLDENQVFPRTQADIRIYCKPGFVYKKMIRVTRVGIHTRGILYERRGNLCVCVCVCVCENLPPRNACAGDTARPGSPMLALDAFSGYSRYTTYEPLPSSIPEWPCIYARWHSLFFQSYDISGDPVSTSTTVLYLQFANWNDWWTKRKKTCMHTSGIKLIKRYYNFFLFDRIMDYSLGTE